MRRSQAGKRITFRRTFRGLLSFNEWHNFQRIYAVAQPRARAFAQLLRSYFFQMAQPLLVSMRILEIRLVRRQNVRLASETSDSFHTSDKTSICLSANTVQFSRGRAIVQEPVELFVNGFLHFVQVFTLTCCGNHNKLASNFALIQVGAHLSSNLIVVDESLV